MATEAWRYPAVARLHHPALGQPLRGRLCEARATGGLPVLALALRDGRLLGAGDWIEGRNGVRLPVRACRLTVEAANGALARAARRAGFNCSREGRGASRKVGTEADEWDANCG